MCRHAAGLYMRAHRHALRETAWARWFPSLLELAMLLEQALQENYGCLPSPETAVAIAQTIGHSKLWWE